MNKEENLLKLKLLSEQNYNDSLIECINKLLQENKQLKEQIKELEEYKWKYEELCK